MSEFILYCTMFWYKKMFWWRASICKVRFRGGEVPINVCVWMIRVPVGFEFVHSTFASWYGRRRFPTFERRWSRRGGGPGGVVSQPKVNSGVPTSLCKIQTNMCKVGSVCEV